ncbi:phage tail protein [Gilvimarinus algae]|uniref:Tail fiber protein n=1 Tax=Gilvimarinus algae TaxID=3058037 RepID=A0ABT8TIX9_9GAMM|nr:tail fiber protein [Gilvimarinus sp. SDUM040014]MDO3383023.1 tail fiber protein [Gilvimarinus sp. SDUM040014]
MSEPFLAEVRMVGFNFAPRGWAFCDGQILPINQNQSLYSLLGTTYGGDGRTSFALPDLRGRTPIHVGRADSGTEHRLGNKSGEETHTLSVPELPEHRHIAMGAAAESTVSSVSSPGVNVMGLTGNNIYGPDAGAPVSLKSDTIAHVGGSQAHDNMMPYLAVNFCIAIQGLFPSRN